MNSRPEKSEDVKLFLTAMYALLKKYDDSNLWDLLHHWPDLNMEQKEIKPFSYPAQRMISAILALSRGPYRDLVHGLVALAPKLMWSQNYRKEDFGERFLENYACTELVGALALTQATRLRREYFYLDREYAIRCIVTKLRNTTFH